MRQIRCKVDGEMGVISIYGNVIDGDLDLSGMDLEKLPDLSDITVTGSFDCSNNRLISLDGAPRDVGYNFDCHGNCLYTLNGAPSHVDRDFNCSDNYLSDLMGGPQHVGGSFDCSHNNSLKWLKGGPRHVGGSFDCSHNRLLKTLKDGPQFVGRDFICRGAVSLTSKSKRDLPENIRGRCEIEYLEQASVAEQEVEVRGADFSEEKCVEMAENILAKFKQEHPALFVSTEKGKTEKDTAENNSVSLAVKTKKKIPSQAQQKTEDGDADFLEEGYMEMAQNILAEVKQKHPELFESTKTGETEKDTAENNSVSLAVKTKKKILDRARQKSKQKSK